jgi:NADPH2:quinone reductase
MNHTQSMRAVVLERFGGPQELHIATVPRPVAGPGELLVKVAYAGINPADWKDREGHTAAFFNINFPYIIGFDAAGTVAGIGPGVTGFSLGDRVFTPSDHGQGVAGSYAQYITVSRERLVSVPDSLDLQSAAAVPVAALTAWQALFSAEKGNLMARQRVMIHGASGGLGSFAIQFAKLGKAEVATSCSARNLDYVRSLGSDLALDYHNQDFTATIAEWAPGGLDLIIDAVGAGTLPEAWNLLRPGGRLVSIATLVADGDIEADCAATARRGCHKVYAVMDDTRVVQELSRIAEHLAAGEIRMPPVACLPMDQVRAAHQQIQGGHVRGKLVLRISDALEPAGE